MAKKEGGKKLGFNEGFLNFFLGVVQRAKSETRGWIDGDGGANARARAARRRRHHDPPRAQRGGASRQQTETKKLGAKNKTNANLFTRRRWRAAARPA
jgi:hypothetical protein